MPSPHPLLALVNARQNDLKVSLVSQMERTIVHPLLNLIEQDNNNANEQFKLLLTHHIDATVGYQFDLLKNTLLKMILYKGFINPLFEYSENDTEKNYFTSIDLTFTQNTFTTNQSNMDHEHSSSILHHSDKIHLEQSILSPSEDVNALVSSHSPLNTTQVNSTNEQYPLISLNATDQITPEQLTLPYSSLLSTITTSPQIKEECHEDSSSTISINVQCNDAPNDEDKEQSNNVDIEVNDAQNGQVLIDDVKEEYDDDDDDEDEDLDDDLGEYMPDWDECEDCVKGICGLDNENGVHMQIELPREAQPNGSFTSGNLKFIQSNVIDDLSQFVQRFNELDHNHQSSKIASTSGSSQIIPSKVFVDDAQSSGQVKSDKNMRELNKVRSQNDVEDESSSSSHCATMSTQSQMDVEGDSSNVSNSSTASSSSRETHKQHIESAIKSLYHACQCHDSNCRLPSCIKMKRAFQHYKSCNCRTIQLKDCTVASNCLMLFCAYLKRMIKQPEFLQRLQQALNVHRQIASMDSMSQSQNWESTSSSNDFYNQFAENSNDLSLLFNESEPVIEHIERSIPSISEILQYSGAKQIQSQLFGDDDQSNGQVMKSDKRKRLMSQSSEAVKKIKSSQSVEEIHHQGEEAKPKIVTLEVDCTEPDCKIILKSLDLWKQHLSTCHGKMPYKHLRDNARHNQHGQTEYPCAELECQTVCQSQTALNLHWRSYHLSGKYECSVCAFGANFEHKVRNHYARIHFSSSKFQCTHQGCDRVLRSSRRLAQHQRIHSGKRPKFGCVWKIVNKQFQ